MKDDGIIRGADNLNGDSRRSSGGSAEKVIISAHAIRQMSRPERVITPGEVERVVGSGEVIEDYVQDPRGHSCLLLGFGEVNRAVHVVCSPKDDYLAIITAYLPDPDQWSEDFKRRR